MGPTLPGTSSCANLTMAGKAADRISPIGTIVQVQSAKGSARVKGSTPGIEPRIRCRLPK